MPKAQNSMKSQLEKHLDYRKTDPMVDEKTMFSYEVVTYASDIERGKKGSSV